MSNKTNPLENLEEELMDYVSNTPNNANPSVVKSMVRAAADGVSTGGGSGIVLNSLGMPVNSEKALEIYNAWLNGMVLTYVDPVNSLAQGGSASVRRITAFGLSSMDSSGNTVQLQPMYLEGDRYESLTNFHSGSIDADLVYWQHLES